MLTLQEVIDALQLEALTPYDPAAPVTGGYTGDLLSWVMSRCGAGDAWITVMGSVNAVAVAVLADAACILLADSAPLDAEAKARAVEKGVVFLRGEETAFALGAKLEGQLTMNNEQ